MDREMGMRMGRIRREIKKIIRRETKRIKEGRMERKDRKENKIKGNLLKKNVKKE